MKVWKKTAEAPTTPFPGSTLKKYVRVPLNAVPPVLTTFEESTVKA